MPSDIVLAFLAYGHVLSAMAWLGGGILTGFVIGPNLRKLPPPAALEFNAKVLPKIVGFVRMAIASTLVFGLLLVYVFKDGDFSWLSSSTQGYVISLGALLGLIAAGLAFSLIVPSFNKVSKISAEALQKGGPPSPDMMKYGKRARNTSVVTVLLLLTALLMMVISGFLF